MATAKKKGTTKAKKPKTVKKKVTKKTASRKSKAPVQKAKKTAAKRTRRMKCCSHCPDYENCDDRGTCCEYCDYYLKGKCTYGKRKSMPVLNQDFELPDYRGDDFGIDDYEAYEAYD
jgi:hypothetical protein